MMEGIEVLSVGSIGINQVFNWDVAIAGGIFLGIILSVWIGLATESVVGGLVSFLVMGAFFGILLGANVEKYADTVPTYKVIVSDTVSINEFYERYEVLEQDGKIFTIKEKIEDGNNSLSAP